MMWWNINGAIDITTMDAQVRMDDTINGDSTLALIKKSVQGFW
jgi:hypothetical protein